MFMCMCGAGRGREDADADTMIANSGGREEPTWPWPCMGGRRGGIYLWIWCDAGQGHGVQCACGVWSVQDETGRDGMGWGNMLSSRNEMGITDVGRKHSNGDEQTQTRWGGWAVVVWGGEGGTGGGESRSRPRPRRGQSPYAMRRVCIDTRTCARVGAARCAFGCMLRGMGCLSASVQMFGVDNAQWTRCEGRGGGNAVYVDGGSGDMDVGTTRGWQGMGGKGRACVSCRVVSWS